MSNIDCSISNVEGKKNSTFDILYYSLPKGSKVSYPACAMFLPTGDSPNPKNFTPWVTYALIGLNIAIYLFITIPLSRQGVDSRNPLLAEYIDTIRYSVPPGVTLRQVIQSISNYDLYLFSHGFKPGAPQPWDLLFSMFLHGGLAHIFGNMLFLFIYGDNVEHRVGRFRYLVLYLLTGVAATVFFSVFARGSMIPMVGASGAISGVLGLYFLLFPRNEVKVFIFLFPILMDFVLLPARLVLGIYLVLDNLLPFFFGAHSGVAHGAHIGGFIAGWCIAFVGERHLWRRRLHLQVERDPDETPPDPMPERLRKAIHTGNHRRALHLASEAEPKHIANLGPKECIQLSSWMEEAGYAQSAARILRGCIARHRSSGLAEVYLQLGMLRLRQGQDAAAYQHLMEAIDRASDPDTKTQAKAALEHVNLYRRK